MEDIKSLIVKAKAGDKEAFSELYEATKDKAYFIAARYVGADDSSDVLQEAYISAMLNLSSFDEAKPFEPWLHTIVRNKALDHIKKKKPVIDFDELSDMEDTEAILPEFYLESESKRRDIMAIIDKLPDVQRITVILHYLEGRTNEEIAELMDCSINTVGSRLRYARKAIREAVLMEEERGNKLYGIAVPVPFLTKLFKIEMESGIHHIPDTVSAQVSSIITDSLEAGSTTVAGASAEGAVTSSATAGGTSAGTTATSIGFIGKLTALSVGMKAVIVAVCAVVVVAGVGVPLYLRSESQKAIQAALVFQQEQEEQSRLAAESLASQQEAERAEAERIEAERAEAERLEAERLETERLEAERVEAERLEAERLEAEQSEAAQSEAAQSEAAQSEAAQSEVTQSEAVQSEVSQQETPPPPPSSASPVTLTSAFGSVTISDVTSTTQKTLDFIGEMQTITVYTVPATCKITFNDNGSELSTYKKLDESHYRWINYVYIDNNNPTVSLSRDYDFYVITQDSGAGLVHYGVIIDS